MENEPVVKNKNGFFKDMKVSRKLLCSFVVLLILFAIAITVNLICLRSINNNFHEFYSVQYEKTQTCLTMRGDLQGSFKALARVALAYQGTNKQTQQDKIQQLNGFYDEMGKDLEQLNKLDIVSQTELAKINSCYKELSNEIDTVIGMHQSGNVDAGIAYAQNQMETTGGELRDALDTIIKRSQEQADTKYEENQKMVTDIFVVTGIVSLLILIVVCVLCYKLTQAIVEPLRQVEVLSEALAEGNLEQGIDYTSKDEFGIVADSLRETMSILRQYIKELDHCLMILGNGQLNYTSNVDFKGDFVSMKNALERISKNLTSTVHQINTSADQVLVGSEQIAGSAQALSQATLEQASSVEELGATINDISDRVSDNADNALETSKLANAVGKQVADGSAQMIQMREAMETMKDMSGQITGIIKEIEDIAFQTNILSLNASVEAARAGESGRGFSVVANEIRRLSTQTTAASKSTGELINKTVNMMATNAAMAEKTSDQLEEAVEAAKTAANHVDDISRASNDQATAVVQLRQSIELISDVVQENSATAEESAASSEELSGQMQMLKKLVAAFEYDVIDDDGAQGVE